MKIFTALLAIMVGMATLCAQTFRVAVEAVRVDVLVTDGNQPIAGLTAADFELLDSGVLQQIDSLGVEDVPLSVLFVLDTSYSMNGAPLQHLKDAASAVIDLLAVQDRAAVLTFSEFVTLRSGWTADHAVLKRAIATAQALGATSLHDASYAALTMRDAAPARPLVLIFSDGNDTSSWLPGQSVLDVASRSEAVVYGVGLVTSKEVRPGFRMDLSSGLQPVRARFAGTALLDSFLSTLADESGGKYLDAERSEKLRDTFVRIVQEFRSRYLLSYRAQGVSANGWHPIEVKLKNTRGKVTARRGYLR
jgi:VWFA-related protein